MLIIGLMLPAGASIATQTYELPDTATAEHTADRDCKVDRIVQNSDATNGNGLAGLDPQRISLLNWNIYKGKRDDWVTDFKRYSHKHDILTIQEARLDDEMESVLVSGHQYWALNVAFDYWDKGTGVMTASMIEPAMLCGQREKEPWIRTAKTSLVSYYPLVGVHEQLLVANVHGINFTLGVKAYNKQIDQLYDLIKHHEGPVILAGDFNTWSDERMRIVQRLAKRLALSSLDYTSHNRTSVFGHAVDHVFYRGLEPLEHDTWQVFSSDHNPTRVSFRIKSYYLVGDGKSGRPIDENNC
jgi:endonuclease/exonuclease/phosphatase (EEP) superfamily protein YafD